MLNLVGVYCSFSARQLQELFNIHMYIYIQLDVPVHENM